MPPMRHDHGDENHSRISAKRQPAPEPSRKRLDPAGPCRASRRSGRHRAAGGAAAQTSGAAIRHDHDHDHRHQLIARRAEFVGQLVEIGGEHQALRRIAQHQRQTEQLEAEEENQHAGECDRRAAPSAG